MTTRVSAILLAAGESRRMGEPNKLMLAIDGTPLVRRSAQVLLASSVVELIVVLGHEAARLRGLLSDLPLRFVINENHSAGRMGSVHRGLEAVRQRCDAILIGLADLPRIEPTDIDRLINAFDRREKGSILIPTYQGTRGNPVLLAGSHRAELLAADAEGGGVRGFIDGHPELVNTLEMDNDHVVTDIDSPEDYARITGHGPGDPA